MPEAKARIKPMASFITPSKRNGAHLGAGEG